MVMKLIKNNYLYAMHKNKPVKFRAEHYKYIVWNILQRIEALGQYRHGEIFLTRNSSLRNIIKSAKWLEDMSLQQLDRARGK